MRLEFVMAVRGRPCSLAASDSYEERQGLPFDEAQTATQLYHSRQRMETAKFLYRVPDSLEH